MRVSFNQLKTAVAVLCCLLITLSLFSSSYIAYLLFPEIGMVLNSQCSNPTNGWNGKIYGIQIWKNAFEGRNNSLSVYKDHSPDRLLIKTAAIVNCCRRQLLRALDVHNSSAETRRNLKSKPLLIWGAHHKTGTYLAQKIFARLCSSMQWCCLFHVTRDNANAVRSNLQMEQRVHMIGHSQWIWYPEELVPPATSYRFLHFYRKPIKKIVSGYRYHMEGAESWCLKPLSYKRSCSHRPTSSSLSRTDIELFCSSVHLCEPCCRREHEASVVSHHHHQTTTPLVSYLSRSEHEYSFLCDSLGRINSSLSLSLASSPAIEGLRIEAAIDYYESLRMARIVNHTKHDPHTLNIDLDDMMSNYAATIRRILEHIEVDVSASEQEHIVKDLQFFDLAASPLYRWSMANPLVNHVNQRTDSADYDALVRDDPEIRKLYKPIFELLGEEI